MSSTNKTSNLKLSQFIGTDKPTFLTDYNGDMSKIDEAYGNLLKNVENVNDSLENVGDGNEKLAKSVSELSSTVESISTDTITLARNYETIHHEQVTNRELINELADTVGKVNTEIVGISNRNFIIIGDSYGCQPSMQEGWCEQLVSKLRLSAGQYYISAIGGAGFVQRSDSSTLFVSMLESIADSITNRNSITDIVVGGGYNDAYAVNNGRADLDSIYQAIKGFVTLANTMFPNLSRIYLGMIGYSFEIPDIAIKCITAYNAYRNAAQNITKCIYMHNTEIVLKNPTLMLSDLHHPNEAGNSLIASAMKECIQCGNTAVSYRYKLNMIPEAGVTELTDNNQNGEVFVNLYNHLTQLDLHRLSVRVLKEFTDGNLILGKIQHVNQKGTIVFNNTWCAIDGSKTVPACLKLLQSGELELNIPDRSSLENPDLNGRGILLLWSHVTYNNGAF